MKSIVTMNLIVIALLLFKVDFSASRQLPECRGTYLPYREDCTKFYLCLRGRLCKLPCSKGLHWNEKRKTCDPPEIAKCVPIPHKNEQATETVTESITEAVTEAEIVTEPPTEPIITEPATETATEIVTPTPRLIPKKPDLKVICYCKYTIPNLNSF